jgi:iron complex outermembrane recepter protein
LNLIEVILAQGSTADAAPPRALATARHPAIENGTTMARQTRIHFFLTPIASAAWLLAAQVPHAAAQTTELQPITVTGRATPVVGIGGWGDTPLAKTPLQASVFGSEQLKDGGVQRLSDLTSFDPAVSDAYNAEGYWDFLTVRGYVIDNRFNFRRDGLPINAETSIPLDNKSRIEILKGTSGMQAGTSAPGGLVNYVVKRPLDAPLRSAFVEWRQPGTVTGALDLSQRFGADNAFGVRLTAAAAHLDPQVRSSRGNRHSFALAADWRASTETLLEAELETSHRSQPSQPGFSMLGDVVPSAGDPRLSLNNQPWSLPVVFDATTASLRWQQKLGADWRFVAHAARQQLTTDDRLAFPFGCTDPNPAPDGTHYPDRYCPSGTFDLYDFRSEHERRRTDALDLSLQGKLRTGPIGHALTVGVQQSRVRNRFERQAYNYVGTGNIEGTLATLPDPSLTDENTNRDERSTELYARDAIAFNEQFTAWLGLRHTRLQRESVRTDGSRPTDYPASFTTPSIALSYAFARDQLVYASWGRGVESNVVPNRSRYTNASDVFTTKSRQVELGLKGESAAFEWNLAAFDVQRPRTQDFGTCDLADTCTTRLDGSAHHRGIEASGAWREGPWSLRGGAQWLRARVEGSAAAALEGQRPTNVPARTVKLQAAYDVHALRGLNLQAGLVHESDRIVLPDNSASIPAWTRFDAALRYETRLAGAQTTWRAGIDNLFDKRAWRESPYQFSHVYLYPLAPRTLRFSVQVDL